MRDPEFLKFTLVDPGLDSVMLEIKYCSWSESRYPGICQKYGEKNKVETTIKISHTFQLLVNLIKTFLVTPLYYLMRSSKVTDFDEIIPYILKRMQKLL